jgi:hypothetical protein
MSSSFLGLSWGWRLEADAGFKVTHTLASNCFRTKQAHNSQSKVNVAVSGLKKMVFSGHKRFTSRETLVFRDVVTDLMKVNGD